MLFSGGGKGGAGGVQAGLHYTISGTPLASATRGDQGAKALRNPNPFVTTHAEIPSAGSGVSGLLLDKPRVLDNIKRLKDPERVPKSPLSRATPFFRRVVALSCWLSRPRCGLSHACARCSYPSPPPVSFALAGGVEAFPACLWPGVATNAPVCELCVQTTRHHQFAGICPVLLPAPAE